jgi:peroxiredoxin family protein
MKKQKNIKVASAVGDEKEELSQNMFGKPVKDLNPSELEELMEEIERLRNKFLAKGGRVDKPLGPGGKK